MELAGDWLAELGLCRICGLAMPRTESEDGICSRACAGRRKSSHQVWRDQSALTIQIQQELVRLAADSTLCPGELSCRILPQETKPIGVLRPLLFQLAKQGKIQTLQKGSVVLWSKIRGPFRVRIKR
jgi:hypothetical protein